MAMIGIPFGFLVGSRGAMTGIGAGAGTDAQVLVWQDMAGLTPNTAKFVKRYADVAGVLRSAVEAYAEEVVGGAFPAAEHSYR